MNHKQTSSSSGKNAQMCTIERRRPGDDNALALLLFMCFKYCTYFYFLYRTSRRRRTEFKKEENLKTKAKTVLVCDVFYVKAKRESKEELTRIDVTTSAECKGLSRTKCVLCNLSSTDLRAVIQVHLEAHTQSAARGEFLSNSGTELIFNMSLIYKSHTNCCSLTKYFSCSSRSRRRRVNIFNFFFIFFSTPQNWSQSDSKVKY
jgi:hypothetical protein